MLDIILATARPESLQAFVDVLMSDKEVHLKQIQSGAAALWEVGASTPHLVIIDSDLADTAPLSLVQKLVMVNAMVNTAVISNLSEADFHEESEGLGVLARLPEIPGAGDAADLLRKLRQILGPGG
jgi:hypothetical protein